MYPSISKKAFTRLLLDWNKCQNARQMPWKGEKDPYRIWLSEIILQQTRVEQGLEYYNKFIKTFPDIHKLARAKETKVFKLWEGLGYYTRCRNLITSAKYISKELEGKFPDQFDEIRALKGVGPYTAAAISSFAYNLPYAVLDGNVFRVLARVFGISKPIDGTEGKKKFTTLAEELLDKERPGLYNQAIMDFGAVQCKPAAPLCKTCVFINKCYAFQHKMVKALPVKNKKVQIKKRWFYYLVLENDNTIAIRQREGKDIWRGLYEFPLIETKKETDVKNILKMAERTGWLSKTDKATAVSPLFKQQLSHQLIIGQFVKIQINKKIPGGFVWSEKNKLTRFVFPKLIHKYVNQ